MAIDRADWHWDSAEEAYRRKHRLTGELTDQQVKDIWFLSANHIGLFLRWIIERGLEGEEADEADAEYIEAAEEAGAEAIVEEAQAAPAEPAEEAAEVFEAPAE